MNRQYSAMTGRQRSLVYLTALGIMIASLCPGNASGKMSVIDSPHNLSASGGRGRASGLPGVAFTEERRICVFCHVPHNATSGTPLWSRALPPAATAYKPYESTSLNANPKPDKPTGSSRLCLSCHDGTIGLGSFAGSRVAAGNAAVMPTGSEPTTNPNLTTDLRSDHPISFNYTDLLAAKSSLALPASLPPAFRLENGVVLQCRTCHDPHDNSFKNFLVISNAADDKLASPLCVTCHKPLGWEASSHNLKNTDTMTSGCMSCHIVHSAPAPVRLLNNAKEEATCLFSCHADVKPLFDPAMHRHPVDLTTGIHDEPESLPAQQYHVECIDCHNPHQANHANAPLANPPQINGSLQGVRKDNLGSVAVKEYEICFRCHAGDFAYRFSGVTEVMPNRMLADPNQFNRFDVLNPSFHPVTADRRIGSQGASLLTALKLSMVRIYCTDCHNSDQGSKALGGGAGGPNGPHGSQYPHILIAQYDMSVAGSSRPAYSNSQYALCFRCHPEDYVMTTGSAFNNLGANEHGIHVRDRQIPCFACHDPHGTPWKVGATAANNAHLINFDKGYAAGLLVAVPQYVTNPLFPGSGSCTVNCHTVTGHTHDYGAVGSPQRALRRFLRK